ncbi:helix-turn-helix domain-containing protein [Cutibacterium sp.]|uniref:helix-turn-helix domain-containing protein n=1 Tax=Cutibacterium sp. TaxID=1912221 RepID=UPI0034C6941B
METFKADQPITPGAIKRGTTSARARVRLTHVEAFRLASCVITNYRRPRPLSPKRSPRAAHPHLKYQEPGNQYRCHPEAGLADRTSRPARCPHQTPTEIVETIARLRRERQWSARLICIDLADRGIRISQATVGRWLRRLWAAPSTCPPHRSVHQPGSPPRYRGRMIHPGIKKGGRIPEGGG